jgi:translation initiation factor IF-2
MAKKNMATVMMEQTKTNGTGCAVSIILDNGYVKRNTVTILISRYKTIARQNNER